MPAKCRLPVMLIYRGRALAHSLAMPMSDRSPHSSYSVLPLYDAMTGSSQWNCKRVNFPKRDSKLTDTIVIEMYFFLMLTILGYSVGG